MTDNDLLVKIGADLSSFDSALQSAETSFKNTLNTINTFSKSNKLELGFNVAQFVEGKERIKKEYMTLKNDIMKEALDFGIDIDNSDLEKYTDDFLKMTDRLKEESKQAQKEISNAKIQQGHKEVQQREKDQAKELADLKKHIQEKYALEDKARDVKNSLSAQKKKEYADAYAEAKAYNDKLIAEEKAQAKKLQHIAIKSKKDTYNRIIKIKHLTDRKEIAAEYKKMRNMSHAQLREYEKTEAKKTAIYQKQASRRRIDSAVGRSFFDSVGVVAKYGAISQALYGIQNAFTGAIRETIRFNQSIYTLQAVLQKTHDEGKQLADGVVKLGKQYGGSFEDIERGMLTLGRAGVDGIEELQKATKVLAQLSLITGDTMEEGAAAMATMLNVYPELREEVTLLGDKMGYVANETRLGIADFSTISNYALTTAKALNFTSDAYLALNGAMSKIGLNASTIGTNIRRIKNITDDDSQAMQEFFRVLGISQEEFAKNMREDSEKELVRFSRALANLSKDSDRYSRATKALNIQVKGTIDNFAEIGKQDHMQKMLEGVKDETNNLESQTQTATIGMQKAWERVRNTILSLFEGKANELFDEYFNRDNIDAFNASIEEMAKGFEEWFDTIVQIVEIGFYAMLVKWAAGFLSLTTGITAASGATLLLNSRLALLAKNPAFLALLGVGTLGAGLAMFAKEAYTYADKLQNPEPLDDEQMLATNQAFANQKTAVQELTALHAEYADKITDTENALRIMTEAGTLNAQTDEFMSNQLVDLKENLSSVEGAMYDLEQQGQLMPENLLGTGFDINNVLVQYDQMVEYGGEMVAETDKIKALQRQLQVEIEKANGTYDKRKWILADIARLTMDIKIAEAAVADSASEGNVLALLRLQIKLEKERQKLRKDEASGSGASDRRAALKLISDEIELMKKKAELKMAQFENTFAINGLVASDYQMNEALTELYGKQAEAANQAYIEAVAKYGTTHKEATIQKKLYDLQIKAIKADTKYWKQKNKNVRKFQKDMQKAGNSFADALVDGDIGGAFEDLFNDILNVFIKPLKDSFTELFSNSMTNAFGGMIDSFTEDMAKWTSNIISEGAKAEAASVASSAKEGAAATAPAIAKAGSQAGLYGAIAMAALLAAIGLAVGAVGSSLGSTVSAEELEAAKGRTDFDDDSIANLTSALEDVQYPLLEATYEMSGYLRSMDKNFISIASSLTGSTSGLDLTGADYIPEYDNTLWGIWGESSSELIGSGLAFLGEGINNYMNGLNSIQAYTTELIKESSWFGLVEDESIRRTMTALDPSTMGQFNDVFTDGFNSILDAAVLLGYNYTDIARQLRDVDLERIDVSFEGLSDDEIVDRLSNVFSEIFSSLVGGVESLNMLTDRYKKAGEASYETLSRIAVEYDQASYTFGLIGKEFKDSVFNSYSGLYSIADSVSGIFGDIFGGIADALYNSVENQYTAQMQILDIVESAGGMDSFNDAMNSFMTNFYDDSEQLEFLTKSMQQSFDTLGVTMPTTNDGFRELIENFDTSTEAGAETYGQLILLSEGFAQMTDAAEALNEVIKTTLNDAELFTQYIGSATSFESRRLALTEDEEAMAAYAVTSAEMMLDAITAQTELYGITMDNYQDQFTAAHLANELTSEQLDNWTMLGDALLDVEEAQKAYADSLIETVEAMDTALKDAWIGNLSYLTNAQKTAYAEGFATITGYGEENSVNAFKSAAETALKTTATKEEYIPYFERYIDTIEDEIPEATTDDVVFKLDELIVAVKEMDDNNVRMT